LLFKLTISKLGHDSNAYAPIFVRLEGRLINNKLGHMEKTNESILIRVLGKLTDFKLFPLNTFFAIYVTPSGIVTIGSFALYEVNTPLEIVKFTDENVSILFINIIKIEFILIISRILMLFLQLI
jgi:hypothetical protein